MKHHSCCLLSSVLEIARLWPHLMRDVPVRDMPALEGRSGVRTH